MLNIVVCDDDMACLNEICKYIEKYFLDKHTEYSIYRYSCGEELVDAQEKNFDIAFLDVEMKKINGIQAGYELRKINPDIQIFVITSYTQYLDDAMDLRVFRYIEKPIDTQRIYRGMDIVLRKKKYEFISDGVNVALYENEIAYIYKSLRKSILVRDNGSSVSTDMTIKEWLELLKESNTFSSPHYSYIVNLNYVSEINDEIITIQLKNGMESKIYPSRRKFKQFKDDFYSKMSEYR